MQFVGNDIVAYKHIRCVNKWQDNQFVQKVLLESEVAAFNLQNNKNAFLWMLWSIKEAAYKLSCFLGNREKFRVRDFEVVCTNLFIRDDDLKNLVTFPINLCDVTNQIQLTVNYKNEIFFANTILTHQFVHSMVSNKNSWDKVICYTNTHTKYNKNDFSIEVRNFTKQTLERLSLKSESITKDKDGIPFVIINNQQQYISLSHDQQFVSFAFVN